MSQRRVSIYGATCASENAADAAWMRQQRALRDEVNRASENAAGAKWMSQCRVLI